MALTTLTANEVTNATKLSDGVKLFSCCLLVSVVLIFGNPVLASTKELNSDLAESLQLNDPENMKAAQRKALATAALAFWKNFQARIPRNSPANENWLKQEIDSNDNERLNKVASSEQFALHMLADRAGICVDVSEQLTLSITLEKADELYLWLKATQCYSANYELLQYLENAKLSNGRADGEFHLISLGLVYRTIIGKLANGILNE